ncbi:YdbH domain-containing protein [Dongia sp.]|uniref:intermembrane phospholipid transport protein YdbH family protein n=1 Tax=Dongia sp. TaxID=1977262 RepID=UPI0035ADBC1E
MRPKRRRIVPAILRLVLVLLVAVGLAVFFRLELVNRAGPWLLTRELGVPVDLGVAQVDWRASHIDRLILGAQRDLVVEDIGLAYDPLSGRLESVEIGRIALLARYDRSRETGISLGELDPLVDRLRAFASAPGDADGEAAPLPNILIKSIEIGLSSPAGFITGSGQANLNAQAVIAQFTLREQQDFAQLDISLAAPLTPGGKPPIGDLTLNLDARSALWSLLGQAQPTAGNVKIEAHLRMPEKPAAGEAVPLALADWSLTAQGFAHPGLAAPLDGELSGMASYGDGWLTLDKIAGDVRGGLGTELAAKLSGDLRLAPLSGDQSAQGDLDLMIEGGNIELPAVKLTRAKASLPLVIAAQREAARTVIDITIGKNASLVADRVDLTAAAMSLTKPVFSVQGDDATKLHAELDQDGFATDFTLAMGKSTFGVEPMASGERLLIAMPEAKLNGHYATGSSLTYALDVKGAQVAAPLRGLTLGQVALALTQDDKGILAAKMKTGALAGLGAFTPVAAEADATLQGDMASFKAHFKGDGQPLDLSANGKVDLTKFSGTVDLKLAPIDFVDGGLQPYNLFPAARDYLDNVSGRVELEGPVAFNGAALTSDLKFALKNFSGKVGPVQLTNVNSVLEIDRPWPLSTKPDQAVAVELADIGLPLTNALFRFKVSDGKRLDLAESRLDMAGGKVTLDPATLSFDAPAQNLLLKVDGISVGELFDTLGIAGLTGEGAISGAVPVTIFPGGIAIPDAKLAATAPGVLRYDRAQAPLALQSAGESVAMALEALSDFHYEKLILDLTRNLTGDVVLGLHIAGRNPSFYDGYPVEFNLSVEGRLDQALKEGLAGYKVPDMIQQQLEKISP